MKQETYISEREANKRIRGFAFSAFFFMALGGSLSYPAYVMGIHTARDAVFTQEHEKTPKKEQLADNAPTEAMKSLDYSKLTQVISNAATPRK